MAILNSDDLAWVSRKLNAHYVMVKKSTELTDQEKKHEIFILAKRADSFGLDEIVGRLGYMKIKFPLGEGKEASLFIHKNYTVQDIEAVIWHVENIKTIDSK